MFSHREHLEGESSGSSSSKGEPGIHLVLVEFEILDFLGDKVHGGTHSTEDSPAVANGLERVVSLDERPDGDTESGEPSSQDTHAATSTSVGSFEAPEIDGSGRTSEQVQTIETTPSGEALLGELSVFGVDGSSLVCSSANSGDNVLAVQAVSSVRSGQADVAI